MYASVQSTGPTSVSPSDRVSNPLGERQIGASHHAPEGEELPRDLAGVAVPEVLDPHVVVDSRGDRPVLPA